MRAPGPRQLGRHPLQPRNLSKPTYRQPPYIGHASRPLSLLFFFKLGPAGFGGKFNSASSKPEGLLMARHRRKRSLQGVLTESKRLDTVDF